MTDTTENFDPSQLDPMLSPHWELRRGMVLFYPGARPDDMRAIVVKGDADCIEGGRALTTALLTAPHGLPPFGGEA